MQSIGVIYIYYYFIINNYPIDFLDTFAFLLSREIKKA